MNKLLKVNDLTKAYGKKNGVENINFELEPGTITALIGLNGAGKSTTLKSIVGHLNYRGEIDFLPDKKDSAQSLFFIPEDKSLPADILVRDMISFYENSDRISPDSRIRYRELLQKLELTNKLALRVSELSLGQKTALYAVMALCSQADLLVLDEPLSGLDPYARNIVIEELKKISWEGRTIIYSSHILEEVERVADQVLILNNGNILFQGSIDSLKESYSEIIVDSPQDNESLKAIPGVCFYRTETNGMTYLFINDKEFDSGITGKRYRLNLKEIFMYLIEIEKSQGGIQ